MLRTVPREQEKSGTRMTKNKKKSVHLFGLVLTAVVLAAGLLALASPREAEAAFPGDNGKKQKRLTTDPAFDIQPDWQPLVN